jgi:hypothetical protein
MIFGRRSAVGAQDDHDRNYYSEKSLFEKRIIPILQV